MRAAAGASSMRCAIPPPIISSRPTGPASPAPDLARLGRTRAVSSAPLPADASTARGPLTFHLRRPDLSTDSPATRWPRRCSPTACIWSAARSSITGRAASSPPGRRSRTRWSRVSRDAARHTPNLRATQVELYEGLRRRARTAGRASSMRFRPDQRLAVAVFPRRVSTTRPSCGRASAWKALVRAVDPPRRGPGRGAHAARPRSLRAALRALRRAGRGRRSGRARRRARPPPTRGARVILCDEQPSSAGACSATRPRASTASRRSTGCGARSPSLRERSRVTLLPRTTAFGYFPHNLVGL